MSSNLIDILASIIVLFGVLFGSGDSAIIDPALQRDRASITTAKSNVSAICRDQAICLVENYDVSQCSAFTDLTMPAPNQPGWTYSFGDPSTEYAKIKATGTLSGTTFELSCTNNQNEKEVWGRVICADDGKGKRTCASLNAE